MTDKTYGELENMLKGTDLVELFCDYDFGKVESFAELDELIQTIIGEQEITYFVEGIKYLANNDQSLLDSVSLAHDLGYETKNLNSELLATIHYQNELRNEYLKAIEYLQELFS